jgi:hypothetical protein
METTWILPIYKGSFICYERLPKTAANLDLGQNLLSKESI